MSARIRAWVWAIDSSMRCVFHVFAVLLVPPDAFAVGGGADDVVVAVAVEVIDVHLGLRLAEGGGVEGPGVVALFRQGLPTSRWGRGCR